MKTTNEKSLSDALYLDSNIAQNLVETHKSSFYSLSIRKKSNNIFTKVDISKIGHNLPCMLILLSNVAQKIFACFQK